MVSFANITEGILLTACAEEQFALSWETLTVADKTEDHHTSNTGKAVLRSRLFRPGCDYLLEDWCFVQIGWAVCQALLLRTLGCPARPSARPSCQHPLGPGKLPLILLQIWQHLLVQ